MRKIAITAIIATLIVAGAAWWTIGAAGTSTLSTQNATRAETSFGDLTTDALCSATKCTVGLVAAVAFKPGTIPADNPTAQQIASLLQTPDEKWAVSDPRRPGAQSQPTAPAQRCVPTGLGAESEVQSPGSAQSPHYLAADQHRSAAS